MKGGRVGVFIMKIYLIGKSLYQDGIMQDSNANCSLAFAVYDENNKVNANFIQTESMTENLVGITDYGNMFFNSENTDLDSEISVEAIVNGESVSYNVKISDVVNGDIGSEIGSGSISDLETRIGALEDKTVSIENSVSTLQTKTQENEENIAGIDAALRDVIDNINSIPKNIYSLHNSVEIGLFYDGTTEHKLYRKVVDFGTLPNATSKTVAHELPSGFVAIKFGGVARTTNNFLHLPSATIDPTAENNIYLAVGKNYVTITTGKDRTNYTGLVYIEYFVQE